MSLENLSFTSPFPNRGAVDVLRERVVDYLCRTRPSPGSRFFTDSELVERSRLSRSTVRRALDELHREGWIDRRIGSGTFVGPRVAAVAMHRAPLGVIGGGTGTRERKVLRLAVLIFEIGDLAHDWYTPAVLEGIDVAAEDYGITVELLGNRDRDIDAISRRLLHSQPHVLACLAAEPKQAFVIRDAQKLGIPCLLSGTPHLELGLPAVCEDNRVAMKLAVRHLLEQGHRRIGLSMQRHVERWVFDREEAFREALAEAGIDADEFPPHLLPLGPRGVVADGAEDAVDAYIRRHKLTAVIAGSMAPMVCLNRLVRTGRLSVPGDVSVVTFEQNSRQGEWFGGLEPTAIDLSLREIGRELARLARMAVDKLPLPERIVVPPRLVAGETVRSLETSSGAAL